MEVIGTVGLPGSGKSEAASVARELDVPVVTMGDVIRAECRDRGLDPATEHGRVARALREERGQGAVAERSLPLIEDALEGADRVLVDGIRSGVEVDTFEEAFGDAFTLVSIEAPFELRRERLDSRTRDRGQESLSERDERELAFGMDEAIDRADRMIENAGSLSAFHDRVRALLTDRADAPDARTDPTRE